MLTLRGHSDAVTAVAYSRDGARLASASTDSTIKLWDTEGGHALLKTLVGHDHAVSSVLFDGEGERLFSASRDKRVRMWEVASGQCKRVFDGHTDWVLRTIDANPCSKTQHTHARGRRATQPPARTHHRPPSWCTT